MSSPEPAAFLDRDGTLIEDVGFPRDPGQVRMLDGAAPALRSMAAAGLRLVVISNQSGIGRGLITPEQAQSVHQRFASVLADEGIALDGAKYCPHAPDEGCGCRKPSPRMLLEAAQELDLDVERSFMIGDKLSDVEAGQRAGCRTVLLAPAGFDPVPAADLVATDWDAAARFVLDSVGAR